MGFLLFSQLCPEKPGRIGLKGSYKTFVRGVVPPWIVHGNMPRAAFFWKIWKLSPTIIY
jgi:hypothetical protein